MDMPYLDSLYEQAPLSATYAAFPFDQSMNAATALMSQQQGQPTPSTQAAHPGSNASAAPNNKQYPSSIIPDYPDYELEHQTYIINGKVIHGTDYRQNMVIKTPLFWDFVEGKDGQGPQQPALPPSSQSQQSIHDSSDESESKKRTSSEFERDERGVKRAKSGLFEKPDSDGPPNNITQSDSASISVPASVHDENNESYMLQSGPPVSEVPKSYRNTSLAASLARNGITKKGKVPPPLSLAKPGMAPQPVYQGGVGGGHHGHVGHGGTHSGPHESAGTSEYSTIIGEDGLPHYVQRE